MCNVRPTSAFNWLLILLIPLTFTWKIVATGHQDSNELQGNISRFLRSYNFQVTEQTPVDGVPVIRAVKDDCSMIVADVSPDGTARYVMRQLASTMDRSFVVYGGNIYDEQPTWVTVTEDWWTRYLRKLGINRSRASSIMVAATRSCGAERLPWAELSGGR